KRQVPSSIWERLPRRSRSSRNPVRFSRVLPPRIRRLSGLVSTRSPCWTMKQGTMRTQPIRFLFRGPTSGANLILAEKTLVEAAADLEPLWKQDPANDVWIAYLANTQVRLGILKEALHMPGASAELSRKSL